ncbi:MAG: hypothetical protein AB2A00_41295 [Myxococcota bacterium]
MRKHLIMTAAVGMSLACSPAREETTTTTDEPVTNVKLDPPPEGKGWQYDVPEFEVAPGTDQQNCYFYQVPGEGTDPVYVNKFVIAQNDGTHHMNMFRVRTIVDLDPANGLVQTSTDGEGPCFDSHNWADWPLIVNSQQGGNTEWELPAGVAHKFTPGEWIMLQSHYVNASTQETPGKAKVYVNYYTVEAAQVQHELGTLFATKQSIRICQHDQRPKFSGTCQFNSSEPVHIVAANGHFHSRGRRFEMFAWDGMSAQPSDEERFYVSEAWDEPPMLRSPELDKVVPANGGIFYTCEFQWTQPPESMDCSGLNQKDKSQLGTPDEALDCCYTFGGPVDWAEHCNVFAYYYPKTDNIICY